MFDCDACGKQYKHRNNLLNHKRHECGKDPQFLCQICPYKAKQKGVIIVHAPEGDQYQCPACSKTYKYKKRLKNHLLNECGDEACFTCAHCPYNTKQKATLQQHINNKHLHNTTKEDQFDSVIIVHTPGGDQFQCPACSKVYKYKQNLKNHQLNECGKEECFTCAHCPYIAKQKIHLEKHINRKHSDSTACEDQSDSVIIVQTPEGVQYQCSACSKVYKHKKSLRNHHLIECKLLGHFTCKACEFSSKRKVDLKKHFFDVHAENAG